MDTGRGGLFSGPAVLADGNGGFVPCPELMTQEELIRFLRIPEITKAHEAILTVRKLALQDFRTETERAYLIGLMFTALKVMTIMELAPAERDHALMSASLIASRLLEMHEAMPARPS